jgi:hypothetical protein
MTVHISRDENGGAQSVIDAYMVEGALRRLGVEHDVAVEYAALDLRLVRLELIRLLNTGSPVPSVFGLLDAKLDPWAHLTSIARLNGVGK